MHLLCEIGWNKAGPVVRSSQGFAFTTCERCGCDLVRIGEGDWFVPEGYRVRWDPVRPDGAKPVSILQEHAARHRGSGPDVLSKIRTASARFAARREAESGNELPIGVVLKELKGRDPDDQGERQVDVAPPPRLVLDQDFMTDDDEDIDWFAPRQPRPPVDGSTSDGRQNGRRDGSSDAEPAGRREAPPPADPAERAEPAEPERAETDVPQSATLPAIVPEAEPAPGDQPESAPPAQSRSLIAPVAAGARAAAGKIPWATVIVASAILITAAVFLLLVSVVDSDDPAQPGPGSAAPAGQAASVGAERTAPRFVTASIVHCRSAPARQARSVRKLGRGARVELLSTDGEWASVSHRGRQCWVAARYLSSQQPL